MLKLKLFFKFEVEDSALVGSKVAIGLQVRSSKLSAGGELLVCP